MSDELLKKIAKDVADIKAALAASVGGMGAALGVVASSGGSGGKGSPGSIASPTDLDSQYGDPAIKFDPKRWSGASFVGCHLSETSPEYLDCLAEFKEWAAGKDDENGAVDNKGRPKSHWAWKEARLARGWAARLRSGWKPKNGGGGVGGAQAPVTNEDYGDDSDIPFLRNDVIFGRWDRP